MIAESQMRSHIVYTCANGCGYVERARMWDSPPIGRDGQYRCPDCGAQVWDYPRLTRLEALDVVNEGYARAERFFRL